EEIDKAIRVEKLISKGIKVTEKDIEKHYNENKALFKKDQVRVAQVVVQKEEEAKRILNEIKGGTDFAKLAKQYSIDPYKDNGGEMPWMDKGGLYPTLAEACWKLNPGQISDVIKTDWSYHIIKLIDKRPADKITLAMVKNEVKADLLAKIKQDTYLKLIDKLRKKADIKEYLPKEETTSAPGVSPSGQQPAQPSEKSVK
ncbi:MAG: peptidyl-prolyl cis-trans isomerase, partial [Actinobacteria bacterium]|nr:peptidyl-prolyl cis-trans isomerase [Actinomycetota bacterium]